jgi:hypothetical protein
VADGIANGLRPWFTKFSGIVYDRRWLQVVEDIYNWHYRWERYFRNEEPLARVGLVYSQQTATFYGGTHAAAKVEDHTLGVYQALIEARIPFEMVHDRLLDAAHTSRFKLLILPNIAALSEAQCTQLREFAARGGSLLATHETSLYDEWGDPRSEFGLADLFGASRTGSVEGPLRNSYLNIEPDAAGAYHPIVAGLENAGRIINGVYRVPAKARAPMARPLTLVPSYPDLPMEMVYPRQPRTDIPEVFLRESGSSRVVYFPWDIDRAYWEILNPDHGVLLSNAVRWALNEEPPVEVTGPGLIEVTLWRQKDSLAVHLINLTNPRTMKGPFREIVPAGPQKLRLRLPDGRKHKKIQLLESGKPAAATVSAGRLEIAVPSIEVHEVVAIDL